MRRVPQGAMSPGPARHVPRRTVFINPRFQGWVALCFAAVILAGAALFAVFFYRHASGTIRVASLQGHFHFLVPHEILGGALIRHIAVMSAGGLAASLFVFLLIRRRIHRGVDRLVSVFRLSAEGDLSTPTDAPGPLELTDLGKKIDAVRFGTLSLIREAREEAEFLGKEQLPEEEFARRWDALKQTLQRIAP